MGDEANPRAGAGLFPETRWSRIVAARDRPELRRAVLDELCATRWQPLYLHLRKQGVRPPRRRTWCRVSWCTSSNATSWRGSTRGAGGCART